MGVSIMHPIIRNALIGGGGGGVEEALRYGVSSPAAKPQSATNNITWMPYLPSHQNGQLLSWSAYFNLSGGYKLVVLRKNGATFDRVYISPSSITASVGVNTLTSANFGVLNVHVGDLVGFITSSALVAYSNTGGLGRPSAYVSGEPSATGNALTLLDSLLDWQISHTISGVCSPSDALINETFESGALPFGWGQTGGAWTFSGGKATSGTAGLTNDIFYKFTLGNLSSWTWAADFTFDTSGAGFMMATRNSIQTTGGFAIEINSATGNITLYRTSGQNGWSNNGELDVVTSSATGITFSTATTYRMTIVKSFRSGSVTITDVGTPANTYTLTWDQENALIAPTRGFGYGKPSLASIVGTVSVLGTTFVVPTAQPDWLFIGDSIMEGSGLSSTTQGFPRLSADARGATLQTSSQGGAGVLHVPTRLASELPHIRPKNIHFLVGTNDSDIEMWKSRMSGMQDLASGLSSVRVGAVIPETASTIPEADFNPYILAQGWATVRHDLALTSPSTGLGADRNAAMFYDTLHPNSSGHAAMATRFASDVP